MSVAGGAAAERSRPALAVCGSNLAGDVAFSVALRLVDGSVHERSSSPGARGELASLCEQLVREHDLAPADLGSVYVDTGPGSYTGLRVAVTFVRFLSAFGGLSVRRVDSLALLARRAAAGRPAMRVRVMLDARRGRYHTALYEVAGDQPRECEAARAVATAEAKALLADVDMLAVVPGLVDGLDAAWLQGVEVAVVREVRAPELFEAPSRIAAIDDLEPRYLMASYAEE